VDDDGLLYDSSRHWWVQLQVDRANIRADGGEE
jgi:hypothetical protein